jgi:aminopeptidase N
VSCNKEITFYLKKKILFNKKITLPIDENEQENETKYENMIKEEKVIEKLNDKGLLQLKTNSMILKNEEIEIKIYFEIKEKTPGLVFVKEKNFSYCYTDNQIKGSRLWFPSLDNLNNLNTWEFEITTESEYIAICTGELIEQKENEKLMIKTQYFYETTPLPSQQVGFIVGNFKIYTGK